MTPIPGFERFLAKVDAGFATESATKQKLQGPSVAEKENRRDDRDRHELQSHAPAHEFLRQFRIAAAEHVREAGEQHERDKREHGDQRDIGKLNHEPRRLSRREIAIRE